MVDADMECHLVRSTSTETKPMTFDDGACSMFGFIRRLPELGRHDGSCNGKIDYQVANGFA